MATTKYLDYAGLQRYHGKLKTDVITPINNRIDEIVNVGGQPNVIEAVKINNNVFAITDKTASLAMNLTYDSTAKKIKLAIGSETQEIDATDFIKDGMLDNATYNAENKKLTLTFKVKVGKNGKIFGSVSSKQIAEELEKKGINVDKKTIEINYPIDSLGIHEVDIKLHKSVIAKANIAVKEV